MRRRLLNFATYLSLALCVLTAALWARGRITWGYDTASWSRSVRDADQTQLHFANSPFGFGIGVNRVWVPSSGPPGWSFYSAPSTFADADGITEAIEGQGGRRIAGVWWVSHLGPRLKYRTVLVPHWMIVMTSRVSSAARGRTTFQSRGNRG